MIRSRVTKSSARSIAFKRGIATVDIVTSRMLMASGFLRTLFEVFARHETPVDMVTTSEVSVSVTVDELSRLDDIRRDLEELADVEVVRGRALVCLVGQDLKFTPGVHANYAETVLPMKDGLPKLKDFPAELGGSGEVVPE